LQTGKKVLLADLDFDAGSVSFVMNTDAKYSILDAVSIVNDLDHASWEQLVTKTDEGLDVLASPGLLGQRDLLAIDIRQVLALVRPMYDWVVLDLGTLNAVSGGVLD